MPQSQSETLRLLLEVGRLLSSKLDLGELLRTVLESSSRVVQSESASLLLLDEKTQELYFDLALGLGPEAAKVRLKPGQGIAGSVAKSLRPAIIPDVHKDPRWSPEMDARSGFRTRSILAVPMMIKGRLIGVVEAINKRVGSFTDEDLRTFEAFASQAAVAVDNARLFASLKEEKAKLDTIFTEMADGAVLTDAGGRILLANAAARKLMGVGSQPATLNEALADFVISPSLHEMMRGQEPTFAFAAARQQPKRLVLAGRVTRLPLAKESSQGPAADGWVCVFRDETEAWHKEKLKRSFLSLISHKLKTPLASVTGFSELLLEELKSSPSSPSALKAGQTVLTQGRKLSDLVDRLLRYTTLDNPDDSASLKPCSLDEVVDDALKGMRDWLAERKGTVSFRRGQISVVGDKDQLTEVVKNLVENAVKFDEKAPREVSIETCVESGRAVLRVADQGPGIPPEDQDKVFSRFHQIETFFTGQIDGWGLGLPFVKKVVEGHGGQVELLSKLGCGTTVIVRLPERRASA